MVGLGAAHAMFGDCVSGDAFYVSFVSMRVSYLRTKRLQLLQSKK
jgi:hypothetical protein